MAMPRTLTAPQFCINTTFVVMAQDAGVFVPAAASEAAGGDAITAGTSTSGILVFGYGSLIHTPGFEYAAKVEGYIKGWRRVFHQGSTGALSPHRLSLFIPRHLGPIMRLSTCYTAHAHYFRNQAKVSALPMVS